MNDRNHSSRSNYRRKPVRSLVRQRITSQAFNDPRCEAVAELVQATIAKSMRVPLEEAARVARYSPQHFSEFFRDRVGLGFELWQFALRMKHAEHLLVQKPWMPAGIIASAVGYSDISAFSRAFKRYAGISSRQYRWLTRTYPSIAEHLPTIERLDHTYCVLRLAQQHADVAPLLRRLAERMQALSS